MKIIFHGAAREVGKSCIEIQTEGQRYILDAGVKFVQGGVEYPKFLDKVYEVDGIFLSHAHLDHSGALPMLENKKLNCPIYCTDMTWSITNFMLQDAYHLEKLKHVHPAYSQRDVNEVERDVRKVEYDKEYTTKDKKVKFTFLNAGHIPGSACILLEIEGKKILYTGDINTEKTILMKEADLSNLKDIDILIAENTYGERMHPDREDSNKELLDAVKQGINEGGTVLIPAFSVGRAQEILMILNDIDSEIPIYLDGMARKITQVVGNCRDPYVKDCQKLHNVMNRVTIVENPRNRERIAKKKGVVIVTSSGMMQGGPVMSYAPHIIGDSKNWIVLTGYQAIGTRGRSLWEDRLWYDKKQRTKVNAHVRKYDFSAHHGQDSIRKLMHQLNPKDLFLVHGDTEAVGSSERYAKEAFKKTNVHNPYVGEEFEL